MDNPPGAPESHISDEPMDQNVRQYEQYRKAVKHYDEPGQAHELTFSCYRRFPLLDDDGRKRLLSEGIDRAMHGQGFDLVAFVYMPEHVHLLVFPRNCEAKIERLLFAIKRPVSFRIKRKLLTRDDPLLGKLLIRDRPGHRAFRFWQEGPGYDRNFTSPEKAIKAINYIHHNPVRRGLCLSPGDWKWSSWRHYHPPTNQMDPDLPTVHGLPT